MKNSVKWIIIAVVLVGVIAGASVLYNKFSDDYVITPPVQTTAENAPSEHSKDENDYSAPDFTVLDYNGNQVKLSDFKGKPVVINFWATWCFYCKEEMPDFDTAHEKYPDMVILGSENNSAVTTRGCYASDKENAHILSNYD